MNAAGRVRTLVRAARALAHDTTASGAMVRDRLRLSTGLSALGIDLALREHLEVEVSEADIATLLSRCGRSPHVSVVLSANVFTAGLRALALAVATAPSVTVRCSSRENEFVPALLDRVDDHRLRSCIEVRGELRPLPGDEVHLYGSDETIAKICSTLDACVRVRAHGTGFGVALVGVGIDTQAAAEKLAADMIAFDQRGCLSPRIALVEGDERTLSLALALSELLCRRASEVPPGELDRNEQAEQIRFRQTAQVVGTLFDAGSGGIAMGRTSGWIAPPGRNLVMVALEPGDNPASVVASMARHVAAIGVSGDDAGFFEPLHRMCPNARRSELGCMQRPALDGPVDLRHPGPESPHAVMARLGSRS